MVELLAIHQNGGAGLDAEPRPLQVHGAPVHFDIDSGILQPMQFHTDLPIQWHEYISHARLGGAS